MTVVVAWLCAISSPVEYGVAFQRLPAPVAWFTEARPEQRVWVGIRSRLDRGIGLQREHMVAIDVGQLRRRNALRYDSTEYSAVRFRAGWPFLSLQGLSYYRQADRAWHESRALRAPSFVESRLRILPLQPLLAGFAGNTVLFSTAIWLAVVIPNVVRSAQRRVHGQCPACGYPVGPSARCSECGCPVAGVMT